MSEGREARLKRLKMRSMRRGIKEMDLILGAFAEENLANLDENDLRAYDALLDENDQDLYLWVTGQAVGPEELSGLIGRISDHALNRFAIVALLGGRCAEPGFVARVLGWGVCC